ncbi:MAG: ATP-binding protein [Firmicutes bacterium]|nr:ATP-binding protein [Bacillota bacterium]
MLEKKLKMMSCLNSAAIKFLSQTEGDFVEKMTEGVGLIAEAAQIHTVSILQILKKNDEPYSTQVYRWDKNSGGTTKPLKELSYLTYNNFPLSWKETFSSGKALNGPVNTMPGTEFLQKFGVISVFIAPVIIDNNIWGFSLFCDHLTERTFNEIEADIFNAAALMMANTVMRNEDAIKFRDADERMKLMLDATPLCCQLWDENFNTIDCNEAAYKMYGFKDKQEYMDRFSEISPEFQPDGSRSDEKAREYLKKAFESGKEVFEWMHRLPDGTPMPAEITVVRVQYVNRDIIAAYQRDLREEKRMMMEINDALIAAKNANRAKSEFLSKMSHEIRTPMNTILGAAEIMIQKESNLNSEMKELLSKIVVSGEILLGIINDILDLSKIEAGRLELRLSEYDVASLINDSVQLNVMRIGSKPLEFVLNIDKNTPSRLFGDELRIKQILNNLLSNAFKYTFEGTVKFSASYKKDCLVLVISDTGQGMTKEQVAKLFEKFARFNVERNYSTEGTGLGMNITHGLVEMMGGEIFIDSEPDKGTTVKVLLPQKNVGAAVLEMKVIENLKHFRLDETSRMKRAQITRELMPYGKVLVVDDVETNIFVAKGLLSLYELSVDTALSGQTAIDKIKRGKVYDIIFMDHMMPGLDGIETTKILRKSGYNKPIVALTANALAGNEEMFLSKGFDAFISKPIDLRQLNAILNKYVRDKQPSDVIVAAKKVKRTNTNKNLSLSSELKEAFVRDAEKSFDALKSFEQDLNAYVITIHGLKSALANIGQAELSKAALNLEQAGREKNIVIVKNETPAFVVSLKNIIKELKQDKGGETLEKGKADFLHFKLSEIKAQCSVFDKKAAKDALAELKQKSWPEKIKKQIEAISGYLLHSDFDEAVNVAEKILQETT